MPAARDGRLTGSLRRVPFPVRRARMVADAAPVAGGPRLEGSWPMGLLRWADFEAVAPELAAHGRALIERFGFVLAGTIRADGTPRISPVAAHLVSGDLMLVMIPGTHKARDVLRDSRIALQSPVTEAAAPGAEFKLRGYAAEVTGDALQTATADTIETVSGWRPPRTWLYLSIAVQAAAYLAWTGEG